MEMTPVWGNLANDWKMDVLREHALKTWDFTLKNNRRSCALCDNVLSRNHTESKVRSEFEQVFKL